MWRPKDFVSAERKLKKVGIQTLEALAASLRPDELLNEQLQQCGEQPFWRSTLKEFKRRVLSIVDAKRIREIPYSSEPRSKERLLWDMLWAARPFWTPLDLAAAEKKLSMIGIDSIMGLQDLLVSGRINDKLREVGAKAFTADTVRALKAYVPSKHQLLRMFLQEARPLWTPQEVTAAERKLEEVGVRSVSALSEALGSSAGLNRRLQENGFKGFTTETLSAFHRQLEVMYRVLRSAGGG